MSNFDDVENFTFVRAWLLKFTLIILRINDTLNQIINDHEGETEKFIQLFISSYLQLIID